MFSRRTQRYVGAIFFKKALQQLLRQSKFGAIEFYITGAFLCAPQKQTQAEALSIRSANPNRFQLFTSEAQKENHILEFGLGDLLSHFPIASYSVSISPKQKTYPGNQCSKENSHQREDKRNVPVTGCVRVDSRIYNGQTFLCWEILFQSKRSISLCFQRASVYTQSPQYRAVVLCRLWGIDLDTWIFKIPQVILTNIQAYRRHQFKDLKT